MKKILLVSAAVAAFSVANATAASKIGGFYTGVDLGAGMSKDKAASGKVLPNGQNSKNFSNFVYGFFAGYGKSFNSFYVGGELTVRGDTSKRKTSGTLTGGVTNVEILDDNTNDVVSKVKKSISFGIAPRFGYSFGSTMAYIKTGLEYNQFKLSYSGTSTASATETAVATGVSTTIAANTPVIGSRTFKTWNFVPAVGVEHVFGKNILVRGEYAYGSATLKKKGSNFGKVTDHRFVIGAGYQF